jgi:hypothetical protein
MAKEDSNQTSTRLPPPDKNANEAAAALLRLIQHADRQVQTLPDLTGDALKARETFAKIAKDLEVQKF